jgi:hypothetical protein
MPRETPGEALRKTTGIGPGKQAQADKFEGLARSIDGFKFTRTKLSQEK